MPLSAACRCRLRDDGSVRQRRAAAGDGGGERGAVDAAAGAVGRGKLRASGGGAGQSLRLSGEALPPRRRLHGGQ